MPVEIGFSPIGEFYSWTNVRDFGWQWNNPNAVVKTWSEFIQLHWDLNVTRDLNIAVVQSNSAFRFPSESISVSSESTKQVGRVLQEFLSIADERRVTEFIKGLSESIDIDEAGARSASKRLTEIASFTDNLTVSVSKRLAESIQATDAFDRVLEYIRNFNSNIGISTSNSFGVEIFKNSLLRIADASSFDIGFYVNEVFRVRDDWSKEWDIWAPFFSSIAISDATGKDVSTVLTETLSILETSEKSVLKTFADNFQIASLATTTVVFSRVFEESLTIDEAINKTTQLSLVERFEILDEILRGGGDAIISDLRLLTKALTDSEFEELISQTSPTGYGPFVPFIAGDYDYQEALYKVAMTARDLSRPYINQIRYEVDLPDLFAKGEVTLPASRTNVPFNKRFNPDEPPTLTVVVKAGSQGFVPEIDFDIRPDNQSFDIELRDPSNASNLVSGVISWKAQGY